MQGLGQQAASTTAAVERGVARLLGADADLARAAVDALQAQQVLGHGVLLVALSGASRWGTDVPGALARLAQGAPAPASWSDYELRVAAEEAREEAAAALADLGPGELGETAVQGEDAPAAAVAALRAGAGALRCSVGEEAAAVVAADWVQRLCIRVGARCLVVQAQGSDGGAHGGAAVGLVPRSQAYLDALA